MAALSNAALRVRAALAEDDWAVVTTSTLIEPTREVSYQVR